MTDDRPEFNVVQFFADDTYEYVRRNVTAEEACKAVGRYAHSIGAKTGMVRRVIITDGGDDCALEWKFGEGFTFPPEIVGRT